jgi:hypothetical protein
MQSSGIINHTKGNPHVAKDKSTVPAVTNAAGLAARAIARLESAAAEVHAEATNRRGFQAVSSKDGFSAVIRHGKVLIEVQGDEFAIRQVD